MGLASSVSLSSSLLRNATAPILLVMLAVWPFLPPTGSVQVFQPLLCSQNLTAGVMAVAE